jgi:uncharacterized protein (DUF58 family)
VWVAGALAVFALLVLGWPGLGGLMLAVDALFAGLLVWDGFRAGAPARLSVRRTVPTRAKLGLEFERVLELGGLRPGLVVTLYEAYPGTFEALDDEPERTTADAAGRARFVRRYRARTRGRFAFGDVRLRVRGPLGLLERGGRLAGEQALDVEPALAQLSRTLRLAASERWRDLGVRALRQRGGQSEFEALREYVPGDEPRRIDWKASARRAKTMVKSYQVERGQELILLVDCGRRMRARGGEGPLASWTKLDWALDCALTLAAVALRQGDRVGCAAFERGLVAYAAPDKGARAGARIHSLLFPLQPMEGEGDLGRALEELALRHRRRATVLILSDVADPLSLARQRAALASGSRHQRLVFAAFDDPELVRAARGPDAALAATAGEFVAERARSLRALCASGARVLSPLPSEAAAPLLSAWLDARRSG